MKRLERKDVINICKVFLIIAIFFWTYIFIDYVVTIIKLNTINYYVVLILLFEPILHFSVYISIIKKYKIIYFIGTIFIGLNALISMSAQMGLIDMFAIGLSVVLLFFLSISSKILFTKSKFTDK